MAEHLTGTFRYRRLQDVVILIVGSPVVFFTLKDLLVMPMVVAKADFLHGFNIVAQAWPAFFLTWCWARLLYRFLFECIDLTQDEIIFVSGLGKVRRIKSDHVIRVNTFPDRSGLRVVSRDAVIDIRGSIAGWRKLRPAILAFGGYDPSLSSGLVRGKSFPTFERWAEQLRNRLQRGG